MNYNDKAIAALFESKKNYKSVMSGAYDKMQDCLEEGMTFDEGMQQFMIEFEIVASEFLAQKIFDIDLEEYSQENNDQLNFEALQSIIDEESDDE